MRAPMLLCLIALALHSSGARAQACPSVASAIRGELRRAEVAYGELDMSGLETTLRSARAMLRCLSEPLPPADAASLHVIEALVSVGGDRALALATLRGALAANPGMRLSEDLAAPGSELERLLVEARERGAGSEQEVLAQGDGLLMVDGRYSDSLPTERAAVVQVIAPDGVARWSGYHTGGASLPVGAPLRLGASAGDFDPFLDNDAKPLTTTPAAPPAMSPVVSSPPPAPRRERGPALLLAAGGAALGAGALYGYSALASRSFLDEQGSDDQERLERLYRNNHLAVVGAGGLGATALGLVVGAAVEMRW